MIPSIDHRYNNPVTELRNKHQKRPVLVVMTDGDAGCPLARALNKAPCWFSCGSAASGTSAWPRELTHSDTSWKNPVMFFDLSFLAALRGPNPTLTEPHFPMKTKWYSIRNIAFSLHSCLLSALLKGLKETWNCAVISARGEGQVEILAWRGSELDRLQTSPWLVSPAETQPHRQQAKPHGMKSKNPDALKIISHLMRKYNSCGILK